ncbi:MAG: CBS domain-containing protein [Candidatus Altiarchaeales archaeon]|nr:CBS domain-containing protein [Candidatus Altiarchaeales archaeon]
MLIKEAMQGEVVTAPPSMPVSEAVELLVKYRIGSLIIVSGDRAEGILTERDILERVIHKHKVLATTPVSDAMSSPLLSLDQNSPTHKAVETMNQKNIKKLGVTSGGHLVGIVTATDLISKQPELLDGLMKTWTKVRWWD